MLICTFFGHHDCPEAIKPKLREVLIDLVENHSVTLFYVGNKGAFDRMVRAVLRDLKREYPGIDYAVVLERLPLKPDGDGNDTMLPEGIETVPPRFAISWRNKWMLDRADFVVTYVTHGWGGAAQTLQYARRKHKRIINLGEDTTK